MTVVLYFYTKFGIKTIKHFEDLKIKRNHSTPILKLKLSQ